MKKTLILLYFLFFIHIFFAEKLIAQSELLDSLIAKLPEVKDEERVDLLCTISWKYRDLQPVKSIEYGLEALNLANELNYKKGVTQSLSFIGVGYRNLGDYPNAYKSYSEALQSAIQDNDSVSIGYSLINIGNLFLNQNENQRALDYFVDALHIGENLDDEKIKGYCYINLGRAYIQLEKYDEALDNLMASLETRKKQNDEYGVANAYREIGDVYFMKNDLELAKEYYEKSLNIAANVGDGEGKAETLNNLAKVNLQENKINFALKNAHESYLISKEVGALARIKDAAQTLSIIYKLMNDYELAYDFLSIYSNAKDSLFNESKSKEIAFMEANYQLQQKQAEIDLLQKDAIITNKEIEKEKLLRNSFFGAFSSILILAFILLRNNIQKQRTNRMLEKQKSEILLQKEEIQLQSKNLTLANEAINKQNEILAVHRDAILKKNQDIESSIKYASNIQQAMLPKSDALNDAFVQHFIFFKPRDVVSGDFFWFIKNDMYAIIAAVDCTGHGVPGAFMSMIGNELLSQIVMVHKITEPDKILWRMHKGIRAALRQEVTNNHDGMDMAICLIDYQNKQLKYSGAKNPLFLIQKGELIEVKPDKFSVGGVQREIERVFTLHTFSIDEPTVFYIFSDGYQDQFTEGGIRKYTRKRLREYISTIYLQDFETQKNLLEQEFLTWKGKYSQTDDILLIGAKVS